MIRVIPKHKYPKVQTMKQADCQLRNFLQEDLTAQLSTSIKCQLQSCSLREGYQIASSHLCFGTVSKSLTVFLECQAQLLK